MTRHIWKVLHFKLLGHIITFLDEKSFVDLNLKTSTDITENVLTIPDN